jgi:hypothetical protein
MSISTTTSCTGNEIVDFPDGTRLEAILFESDDRDRCHDCNVLVGGFHHPGCDTEECPKCHGQLISCGCLDDPEDDDEEYEEEDDNA